MPRALILQLARLGDLIQSLPAITSLHSTFPELPLDLLCAAPLVHLGRYFPGIQCVYPWEGEEWHKFATRTNLDVEQQIEAAGKYLEHFCFPEYSLAYNLNNHPRSILAAYLFSKRVVGAGDQGPFSTRLPPWVAYLRNMARERGSNRIHLADAFCGMCGVIPPSVVPSLEVKHFPLPSEFECVVNHGCEIPIGLVLGAGDSERRVPSIVWKEFIETCAERIPNCRLLLIGGSGEREASLFLEHQLSVQTRNQVINCCGRTSLPQLAALLRHCHWVVGSDTGPLHLGALCGAQAIGWYFSRARVHETGPYGEGHWVWQAEGNEGTPALNQHDLSGILPKQWPVKESVDLVLGTNSGTIPKGWSLWHSHRDNWGAYYSEWGHSPMPPVSREQIWDHLTREVFLSKDPSQEVSIPVDFQFKTTAS